MLRGRRPEVTVMLLELRHALRGLRRSPGFAASAIVTLALAIGASTAMFGVLDAVLLRPLPFPSPDRLAMVWIEVPTQDLREGRSAFGTVEAWRRQSRSFADVAVLDPVSVALTHAGELEQVSGARVSPNLFGLLGVVPDARPPLHRSRRRGTPAARAPEPSLLARALRRLGRGPRRRRC